MTDRSGSGLHNGSRLDPSHDVRFLQEALRLQQLGDCDYRAMNDWIGDGGAEKGSLELSRFREIGGPFATRLRESEIGARRHGPGRLKHRGDFGHKPRLQCRDGIRIRLRSVQHVLQQAGLLCGGRHALSVDRVEAAERIGDGQNAAGQPRQPFEMLPGAHRSDSGECPQAAERNAARCGPSA